MAHFTQHLQTLDTILYQIRYRDPQRIRGEVADILMKPHVASLTPQSRPLARGGPPQQLLCLIGTIPIVYNGANYNIPLNVWIVDSYPYAPPVIYVTPTSDMAITPRHRHVDLHGMVYHPYLSSWNVNSNLIGIISNLSSVFSAEPPVRSQAPSRPATATPQPQPQQPQPQVNSPSPYQSNPSNYQQPSYPSQPNYSQPPPAYQYPQQQQLQQSQQQQQPNGLPPPPYQQSSLPPPGYPNPPEYTPPKPEDPEVVEKRNALAKANEKLANDLRGFNASISTEIDTLEKEKRDNEEVGASFDAEKVKLQKELEQAEIETKKLTDQLEELTKWVHENDTGELPDIDAATDPKDVLSKQLLGLVATDYTIQDTLYYLDKALASDKLGLDAFLKTIRGLSREQFTARATMRKVEAAQRQLLIQQHQQNHVQQQPGYPQHVVPGNPTSSSYPQRV